MPTVGSVRIGISGWRYQSWHGVFYPPGLAQKQQMAYAAEIFSTIEINGTFYSLQRPESFARWASETPQGFVFSIKGSRYITHLLRLKAIKAALANFFASGVLRLGEKLGPILWQLPPNLRFDPKRIESFLALLPRNAFSAAELARKHDKRVSGRSWMRVETDRPIRHAIEIRHASFATPEFVRLLREHNVALVCADAVARPRLMDLTSDFVYCRLHGSEELYASGYDGRALNEWATRVAAWARGQEPADSQRVIPELGPKRSMRDVFVYFDNDAKVRAPRDAQALARRVTRFLKQ